MPASGPAQDVEDGTRLDSLPPFIWVVDRRKWVYERQRVVETCQCGRIEPVHVKKSANSRRNRMHAASAADNFEASAAERGFEQGSRQTALAARQTRSGMTPVAHANDGLANQCDAVISDNPRNLLNYEAHVRYVVQGAQANGNVKLTVPCGQNTGRGRLAILDRRATEAIYVVVGWLDDYYRSCASSDGSDFFAVCPTEAEHPAQASGRKVGEPVSLIESVIVIKASRSGGGCEVMVRMLFIEVPGCDVFSRKVIAVYAGSGEISREFVTACAGILCTVIGQRIAPFESSDGARRSC